MENLKKSLNIFAPAWMPDDTKQKVVDSVKKIYCDNQTYDIQMRASSIIRNIEVSRIIGSNNIIVPIIIYEYCELVMCCKAITLLLQQIKNNCDISLVQSGIDTKKIGSLLVQDLNFFVSERGMTIDIIKAMSLFKLHSNGDVAKILKENKFLRNGFVSQELFPKELA